MMKLQHSPAWNVDRLRRLLPVLLGLAVPLLACSPAAFLSTQAPTTSGSGVSGTPIAFADLPLTAPCRIAAAFAATVDGLIYSQGGARPDRDPVDPHTGTYYARTGPRSYDCSGMTTAAYAQAGIDIGPTTVQQINAGTVVPCTPADLKGMHTTCWATGDLLFFVNADGTAEHVEMYWRDGLFAACLNWTEGCRVWERSTASFPAQYQVRRIVNDCVRQVHLVVGDWSMYPTSYTAQWYPVTYTGWQAQVLNYLFAQFPGVATSYEAHNHAGGGISADLWTDAAQMREQADNRSVAAMHDLANYIAANFDRLGIRYVVWAERLNDGNGWTSFGDTFAPGDHNNRHNSHIHITFDDAPPTVMARGMDSSTVSLWDVRTSAVIARGRRSKRGWTV